MRIVAESTDTAIASLEKIMPAMAEEVAIKLGIPAKLVQIDNWVVIPYLEKAE